jgi:excisionase family DNA binding protein
MKKKTNLLTIKEVADKLRLSERTVYRYIKAGGLKTIKFSRKATRIAEKDLINFLKKHKTK